MDVELRLGGGVLLRPDLLEGTGDEGLLKDGMEEIAGGVGVVEARARLAIGMLEPLEDKFDLWLTGWMEGVLELEFAAELELFLLAASGILALLLETSGGMLDLLLGTGGRGGALNTDKQVVLALAEF